MTSEIFNEIILAALCVAGISFTITVTSIFKWFRELLSKIHPKIEELVHCPWCFSHYVGLIMLLVSDVNLVDVSIHTWFNFLVTWFAMIAINGLVHYVLVRAYEPVAKAMAARHIEKQMKKK